MYISGRGFVIGMESFGNSEHFDAKQVFRGDFYEVVVFVAKSLREKVDLTTGGQPGTPGWRSVEPRLKTTALLPLQIPGFYFFIFFYFQSQAQGQWHHAFATLFICHLSYPLPFYFAISPRPIFGTVIYVSRCAFTLAYTFKRVYHCVIWFLPYSRWKGSIYKLVWIDSVVYFCLYFLIAIVYHVILKDERHKRFLHLVYSLILITIVLFA